MPFVIDEFGKLGPSATWLLHIMSMRAAERQRGDFRQGRNIMVRAARLRSGWASAITQALHSSLLEGQRQRLIASLRTSAGRDDARWEGRG